MISTESIARLQFVVTREAGAWLHLLDSFVGELAVLVGGQRWPCRLVLADDSLSRCTR
ncbi:hypothetical protein GS464_30150 [Rhodococcus hoagii]|nr:hypothetical protein [Prescottella equi]